MEQKWRENMFTDEVHIHLLQLPAERERQGQSWQGAAGLQEAATQAAGQEAGPKPARARQGL